MFKHLVYFLRPQELHESPLPGNTKCERVLEEMELNSGISPKNTRQQTGCIQLQMLLMQLCNSLAINNGIWRLSEATNGNSLLPSGYVTLG